MHEDHRRPRGDVGGDGGRVDRLNLLLAGDNKLHRADDADEEQEGAHESESCHPARFPRINLSVWVED